MSASILIQLQPLGTPGHVHIEVSTQVSGGGALTKDELELVLGQVLDGLRAGTIAPEGQGQT